MRYRKKPVVIDAIQFTGENLDEIWGAFGAGKIYGFSGSNSAEDTYEKLIIATLEGEMDCPPGWWVVRGVEGELYPVKPSVFERTYEEPDLNA